MADRKITDLTALAAGSQATGDLLTIVDVSEGAAADKNKKITVESLFKGIPSNVGIGTSSPGFIADIEGSGTPLNLNSTNDEVKKIRFENSGTAVGFIGSSSTSPLRILDGSANERMRIDGSGNVGVGTSSPNSYSNYSTLTINGTTGGIIDLEANGTIFGELQALSNEFRINAVGGSSVLKMYAGGSERLRIDSSGRLLVGTSTSPSGGDAHAQNASLLIQGRINNGADSGRINLQRGSAASSGSSIGTISFTDNSNNAYARLEVEADAATGSDDYPGRLVFSTTADGANSPIERMRIDSSGNVGIGHSSPASLLTVGGDAITSAKPTVSIAPSSGNGSLTIRGGAPTINFDKTGSGTNGTIIFDSSSSLIFKEGSLDSSTERLRFRTGGGITFNGDTAAANALDDYEEGDWTPSVVSGGFSSLTIGKATYVKVGKMVHIQCYISSLNGTGNTAALKLGSLPFQSATNAFSAGSVDFGRGSVKGTYARVEGGSNQIFFFYPSENTSTSRIQLLGNQVGASYVVIGVTYTAA